MDSQYIVSQANSLARMFYTALNNKPTNIVNFHLSKDKDHSKCWNLAAMAMQKIMSVDVNHHVSIISQNVTVESFLDRMNRAATDGVIANVNTK